MLGSILSFFIQILIEQSKKDGKDQESIQSSTTPDPWYQWESDNVTIRHHKREPRSALSQQVTIKHQQTYVHESKTKQDRNNINDPQKKHRLGTVSKNILLEGLNRFNSAPTSPLVQIYSISRDLTQSIIYTFYSKVSAVLENTMIDLSSMRAGLMFLISMVWDLTVWMHSRFAPLLFAYNKSAFLTMRPMSCRLSLMS